MEDVARLLLNDSTMTQQLKTMRHEMLRGDWAFHQQLLQSRDAEGDVGIDTEVPGEARQRELPIVVMANARRVQESLRLMEELAKLPDAPLKLDPEKYKQARFSLYSIEQRLLSKLHRRDKTKHLTGVYAIIDTGSLAGRSPRNVAEQVICGGAIALHLRDKVTPKKELLPLARQLKKLCAENDILFIIESYLDLTVTIGADGLCLAPDDLPVKAVRSLLPIDAILGVTATSVEQARAVVSDGADYIMVDQGQRAQLSAIRKSVDVPLVLLGSIMSESAVEVMGPGADAIAVNIASLPGKDLESSVRQFADRIGTTGG